MPLNWKKDEWSEMAKNDPAKFIQELQSMRAPSAKLFGDTYLLCAMEGFRALNSHANALYETQFFEALTRILPHREAKQPDKYTVSRLSYMETTRVPIAFLQWEEALRKNGHGVAKRDYHGWILKLRPKYWYDKENYKAFSLDNAPVWASAYVKAHRGESPFPLLQWLKTAPLQEGMPVISAIAAMEKETPPPWLARGLEAILERTDDIFQSGLIHETIGVLSTALASPTPASDQAILRLMREQPKGMSYMTHAWLGVFHRDGHHNNMLDWWNRLASAERGGHRGTQGFVGLGVQSHVAIHQKSIGLASYGRLGIQCMHGVFGFNGIRKLHPIRHPDCAVEDGGTRPGARACLHCTAPKSSVGRADPWGFGF